MGKILTQVEALPLVLRLKPVVQVSERQFIELCQLNPELRIERTKEGDLVIMPPAFSDTGRINFNLAALFGQWVRADKTGVGFDSSTGFTLPNGAVRSPDVAWVRRSRWEALTQEQREEAFSPLCPDFVLELRSRSEPLRYQQAKMREYMDNGAQLGWLLDPMERKVYVYRQGAAVEVLDNPTALSGDAVLPGFVLSIEEVW